MTFRSPRDATEGRPRTDSLSAAHRRHALTRTEVMVVLTIAVVLVVGFTLVPHMFRSWARQKMCMAALSGIGMALRSYASENNQMFPVVPHALAEEDGIGKVIYAPKKIGVRRTGVMPVASAPAADDPIAGGSTIEDTELSTTRNLWVLVRMHAVSPRVFYCPQASDAELNGEDNPALLYDFQKYAEVSYGYQVPYGRKGQPSAELDPRMPVAADKGPYGAALEAGQPHPGVPNIAAGARAGEWKKWNSPNHDAQNVLYVDGQVEFQGKPTCGVNNDNIYTRWQGAEGEIKANDSARAWGLPPTGRETPWSNSDTLIYP